MLGYKGMRWFKCDLHVQTPREPHWREESTKLASDATPDQVLASARTYLERCHALGLEVIGVTDHNFAPRAQSSFIHALKEVNNAVASQLQRSPITILPGFEITAQVGRGAHVLGIFNANTPLDVVDSRLSTLGLPFDRRFNGGDPLQTTERLPRIIEVIQKAENHQGLVIAAHPLAESGFLNDDVSDIWLQQAEFTNPELLCIEMSKAPARMNANFQRLLRGGTDCDAGWKRNRPIACVLGSDAYRLHADPANQGNHLGYRHTWIKMSEPTVEALRQAFLDHSSRIAYSEASPDDSRRHGRLVSFAVENATYLANQEVFFAPGFTCLVGGRGSGKSTIVEYLRFALRQEEDQAESAIHQVERLGATMDANTRLKVKWLSGDNVVDAFEFRGAVAGNARAAVVDREQAVTAPDAVFGALGVQIFSQRQLSEMSAGAKLLDFVDRTVRNDLALPIETERTAEATVVGLLDKAQILGVTQTELNQIEQSVTELERQQISRSAVSGEAAAHKAAQEANAYLVDAAGCIANAAQSIGTLADTIPASAPVLPEAIDAWPVPGQVRALHADLTGTFTRLESDLQALIVRFRTEATAVIQEARAQDLLLRIAAAETTFVEACRNQGVTAADVDRIREIDGLLRNGRLGRDGKRREVERLTVETASLAASLEAMHAAWRAETNTRRTALERLQDVVNRSGRLIVSSVLHQGSQDDFLENIWEPMRPDGRSRIGRAWDELGLSVFEGFLAQPNLTGIWDFIETWLAGAEVVSLVLHLDLQGDLRQYLASEHVKAEWQKIRTQRIKDVVDFELFRRSGERAGSLSDGRLSDGQRNTILLSLLLADGDAPIIVDQPEDELDSAFIYNELVPVVRERKNSRQIIFVTHNANVPVNADADLVYALRFSNGKGECQAQGGLDRPDVGLAVLDIMEGSRDAFERRREKYHF